MVISVIASRFVEPKEERTRALADRIHVTDGHVVDPEGHVCDGGGLYLIRTQEVHIADEGEQVFGGGAAGHQRERRVEDREHCRELNTYNIVCMDCVK